MTRSPAALEDTLLNSDCFQDTHANGVRHDRKARRIDGGRHCTKSLYEHGEWMYIIHCILYNVYGWMKLRKI